MTEKHSTCTPRRRRRLNTKRYRLRMKNVIVRQELERLATVYSYLDGKPEKSPRISAGIKRPEVRRPEAFTRKNILIVPVKVSDPNRQILVSRRDPSKSVLVKGPQSKGNGRKSKSTKPAEVVEDVPPKKRTRRSANKADRATVGATDGKLDLPLKKTTKARKAYVVPGNRKRLIHPDGKTLVTEVDEAAFVSEVQYQKQYVTPSKGVLGYYADTGKVHVCPVDTTTGTWPHQSGHFRNRHMDCTLIYPSGVVLPSHLQPASARFGGSFEPHLFDFQPWTTLGHQNESGSKPNVQAIPPGTSPPSNRPAKVVGKRGGKGWR